MKSHVLSALLASLPLACVPVTEASAQSSGFDHNLILNSGAEDGEGSLSASDILPVPNWTTTNNFTVVVYDPSFPSPGPAFGTNFFSGGPATRTDGVNPFSSAGQTIDVSALAAQIDAGVLAELSGYFGGYADQNDRASLTATYLNVLGDSLGNVSIGNVLAVDRTNHTALLYRAATNAVPANTRQIQVVVSMTNESGTYYNDGYADNLSLILRPALRITSLEKLGNDLRLSFTSVAGQSYAIQGRADLSSGGWAMLARITNSATGGTVQQTLTNALAQPRQFYRVQGSP